MQTVELCAVLCNSSCYLEFKDAPHPNFDDFSPDYLPPLSVEDGRRCVEPVETVRVFAVERCTFLEGNNLGYVA
jgi:hypothetical protein